MIQDETIRTAYQYYSAGDLYNAAAYAPLLSGERRCTANFEKRLVVDILKDRIVEDNLRQEAEKILNLLSYV